MSNFFSKMFLPLQKYVALRLSNISQTSNKKVETYVRNVAYRNLLIFHSDNDICWHLRIYVVPHDIFEPFKYKNKYLNIEKRCLQGMQEKYKSPWFAFLFLYFLVFCKK